jgi:hypothetical protein
MGPVIDQLYRQSRQMAQEELARTLNKLPSVSEAEREHLEELTRRIVNKLLHDPVHTLRRTGESHAVADQYLNALQRLFNLPIDSSNHENDKNSSDSLAYARSAVVGSGAGVRGKASAKKNPRRLCQSLYQAKTPRGIGVTGRQLNFSSTEWQPYSTLGWHKVTFSGGP